MSAPNRHPELIQPPYPGMHMNHDDSYKYNYGIWKRTGGYKSSVYNLTGLEASVPELNTLVGINQGDGVQDQLNGKVSSADLGTIAIQDADDVAITGGSISNVGLSGSSIDTSLITIEAGEHNSSLPIGGTLDSQVVSVSSSIGTAPLMSFTLFESTLVSTKDYIEISGFGTLAANGNNKQIKLILGLTTIFDTGLVAANTGDWWIEAKIIRLTATSQHCITKIVTGNAAIQNKTTYVLSTENIDANQTLFFEATSVAAADIVQDGFIIKWFKGE
jgi:hypothetical protein